MPLKAWHQMNFILTCGVVEADFFTPAVTHTSGTENHVAKLHLFGKTL